MSEETISKIPIGSINAETQEIDLQWKNLSVFVANDKRSLQNKVAVMDTDEHLLKKYKSSQIQFENENAVQLSRNNKKYDFKCILDNQNGFAMSGQITAIMGPSGAGKTTMLACISQRIQASETTIIKGQINANGSSYDSVDFCSFGVFVMQNDLLIATLTVKESLMFSANMRLNGVSQEEKVERVEQLIRDLKLGACQHTYVGNVFLKGISGGERKRTSIGLEVIANPPVLMLDEPTSGLDSFTAFVIVDILKKIATKYNRTILLTIHQPSSDIFELFDRLILLHDGKTTYQGPSSLMQKYMRDLNMTIPQFCNPCDHFMKELRCEDTQLTHESYEIYLEDDNLTQYEETNFTQGYLKRKTNNSFIYEFNKLAERSALNYFRNPALLRGRMFLTSFFIIFQTCLYYNIGQKHRPQNAPQTSDISLVQTYVLNMQAVLFFLGTGSIFSAMGPLIQLFPIERQIFLKEENSKLYRVQAYFLAKISTELPFAIITPLLQSTVLYYFLGLREEWNCFLEYLLTSILVSLCGNGLGLYFYLVENRFCGCLLSDPKMSAAMAPVILLPLQLFGGLYVNLGSLSSWISWFKYISPFKYFLEALLHTQFDGVTYMATKDQESYTFDPLKELGMTTGLWNCILVLGLLALGLHILAFIFLKLLTKRLTV